MSELELRKVDADTLGQVWLKVKPMMENVYERSNGRMDAATTFNLLHNGDWVLWVVYDPDIDDILAVIGANFITYATGKKFMNLEFATGRERKRWMHLLEYLEQWGIDNGCTAASMMCRKGWQSELHDYQMTHVFLEKDL
jgi:hypothetical protein